MNDEFIASVRQWAVCEVIRHRDYLSAGSVTEEADKLALYVLFGEKPSETNRETH